MKAVVVEKDKILHNLEVINNASGEASLIAVLKANAYGLGLREMADILRQNGVRHFAVTEPEDALRLRDWGFADEEILVLRSTACQKDIETIIEACATATIGSYDAAVALNGIAEKHGIVVDAHIKIDTGMGRYGFESFETDRIISVYRFMKNISLTGMYTHFSLAFRNKKKTKEQYDKFMLCVAKIRDAGIDPGIIHASNSAALLSCGLPTLDAVRVGSAIGGRVTAKGNFGLEKTGRLECEISEIKWLEKGHTVGYGAAYTAKHPIRTAVIPIGTADGFMVEKKRDTFRFTDCMRAAASAGLSLFRHEKLYAVINGKKAPILGHVGLNHTVVDITNIQCAPGGIAGFEVQPMFVRESIERRYI